ncbi:MAG: hypothetical protein H7274_20760 [Rhodoferax sp.]|nr:hypothetical protein [Rhodoferax sp.]
MTLITAWKLIVLGVAMAVWSLWKLGLDRWALVPGGALLAIVGSWLMGPGLSVPWAKRVRFRFQRDAPASARGCTATAPCAIK